MVTPKPRGGSVLVASASPSLVTFVVNVSTSGCHDLAPERARSSVGIQGYLGYRGQGFRAPMLSREAFWRPPDASPPECSASYDSRNH